MKKKREIVAPTSIFVVAHGGYPFDVMVAIGASDSEVVAALAERGIDPTEEEARELSVEGETTVEGRCVMLRGGGTVLRLRNFTDTPKHWGQLAHEVFHAVDSMLYKIGVRHSENSCEAYAYAIQHLMTEITTQIALPPSKRERGIIPAPNQRPMHTKGKRGTRRQR